MTRRLLAIGTAVAVVGLVTGVGLAQRADDEQNPAGRGQMIRAQIHQPAGPGQIGPGQGRGLGPGPGQGLGPGQMLGPGQGRGRGLGQGQGRGFGPGQGLGPGQGRGRMGAFGRGGAGLGPRGGRGAGPLARLNLTNEQQTAIQELQRTGRDQSAAIADELELARGELHRAVFADQRDANALKAAADKVTSLEKQLFDLHLKTQAAVADALTAEQRETMRLAGGGRGRGPGR